MAEASSTIDYASPAPARKKLPVILWWFLADGAMTKRFHPGKASETGLSAALLAQEGMSGPRQVLETP